MFPEFQLLLLIVRGHKGGQKTPKKIQIRPILMKFKPYVLLTLVGEISRFSAPFGVQRGAEDPHENSIMSNFYEI